MTRSLEAEAISQDVLAGLSLTDPVEQHLDGKLLALDLDATPSPLPPPEQGLRQLGDVPDLPWS
ncbi:hypothetical protein ABZ260_06065 [Streptosporangium sp. NPDC006013]|uniref:hypothetical protein n=1 Tax=Streptosporangium sp. NPDC006013 TaxID=3155596 RepID=UPI0033ADE9F6